ncbi:MAG: hypothetical protein ACI8QC_002019 [Planctomycetota bacterium]|jgi:hypothetical protein
MRRSHTTLRLALILGALNLAQTLQAQEPIDQNLHEQLILPEVLALSLQEARQLTGWPPRPDAEAPLGAGLAAHLEVDDVRFSYRLHHEDGDDLRMGTANQVHQAAFDHGFTLAPVQRYMDEHQFSAEFGLGEDLALVLTLPFYNKELQHLDASGQRTESRTSGLGDVILGTRVGLGEQGERRLIFGAGISIPTGSNTLSGEVGGQANQRLPYELQLGSGTYDLHPEIVLGRWMKRWSFGARAAAVVRAGKNEEDYHLGDRMEASAWVSRHVDRDHSLSFRLSVVNQNQASGQDSAMDLSLTPGNRTNATGYRRLDAFFGIQAVGSAGNRFAAEIGAPIVQSLDGLQVDTDLVAWLSWSYGF